MRVTGTRIIELATSATSANQSRVAQAATETSSGLRVAKPSDDPAAYVAAERAKLHRDLVAGSSKAVRTSRDRLDQVDGALATVGEVMSQVRTLAVQGSSATYSATDRLELATQVRTLMQTAIGAANVRSADGEFLLAGTRSLAAPFSAAGSYAGDDTTREVATSADTSVRATVSGADLTAAHGVDVIPLIDRLATALAANDPTAIAGTLDDLAKAVEQVGLARTRVGGAMAVLEATETSHAELSDSLTKTISNEIEVAKASQALETSRAISTHLIGLLDPRST
jgi:flagellar hook-associated protein 3 FlgL